jgi:hypothetical protein
MVASGEFVPDQPASAADLEAYGAKLLRDSTQVTQEFREATGIRAQWIAERIIGFQLNSDQIVRFAVAFFAYRNEVDGVSATENGKAPIGEIEKYWKSERELRGELIAQIRKLAWLRHPPRASLSRRIDSALEAITARAKRKRPELAASNAQAAASLTGERAANSANSLSQEVGAEASSPSS